MKKRKYSMSKRAEQQRQTRERIVDAVIDLHEKVGPANTSIKAVAENAGVQRLTVYRYFPDEKSLYHACTSRWLLSNPLPAVSDWESVCDASKRSHAALLAFCRYYRDTRSMWQSAYRDVDHVEAMRKPMGGIEEYLDAIRDDLLACWKVHGKQKQQLGITLRHCLRFSTWQSFEADGLSDKQQAGLMLSWMDCFMPSKI